MLGADLRYVAPATRFSVMEIEWGLAPDMAGTVLMRRLARDDVVRDLAFTGRIFSATDADTYGFVTRLSEEPLQDALATARAIALKSPHAVQATKRLCNRGWEELVAKNLLAESLEHDALVLHPNQLEAVYARRAKRRAVFTDPG